MSLEAVLGMLQQHLDIHFLSNKLNPAYIKIDIAVNHSLPELWKVLQNALNSVQPLHHLPYDTALH